MRQKSAYGAEKLEPTRVEPNLDGIEPRVTQQPGGAINTATQLLIVGGTSVLAVGFLLGIPMAVARSKAPRAPRYLFAAHLAAIIQGGLLLALTIAIDFSTLSPRIETIAASLLILGVVAFDLGLVLNWLQGVQDGFAEQALGNKVSTVGTPLVLIGTGTVLYGVIAAL